MKKENRIAAAVAAGVALLAAGFLMGRLTNVPVPREEKAADGVPAAAAPLRLPGPGEGIVTFLTGGVFRNRAGIWEELAAGDLVAEGDTVKVVENAAADLQFGGLAAVRLLQNSSAAFATVDSAANGALTARLVSGTGLFAVTRGAGAVRVETPAGALEVTGTDFMVRTAGGGTLAAVGDGTVTGPGGIDIPAGRQVRFGGASVPTAEDLSAGNRERLKDLERVRRLELPDTGIPRMARIVVETSPPDALILLDGFVAGRGSSALIVPFGETLKFSVAKTGYLTRSLEIPVVSAEAEKKYLVRLELDPSPEIAGGEIENLLLLESRIQAMEKEIESREVMFQALAGKSGDLEQDRQDARRETEAARRRVQELEAQVDSLSAALAAERERMRLFL